MYYEQVQSAMRQYTIDQQREYQEDKIKIGSKDNDAKKAAAFLREVRPLLDEDGCHTIDRLKQMVERGAYNQLADALNRISRKQKKEPVPLAKIHEQLEDLDKRYNQAQTQTSTKQVVLATADIILSETFSYANLKPLASCSLETKRRALNNIVRTSSAMSISRNTLLRWMKESDSSVPTLPTDVCNCASILPKTFTQSSTYSCRKITANIVMVGSLWAAATSVRKD